MVTITPPYVIVVPEPIVGVTESTDDTFFLKHEHEEIAIPSAEIGYSTQQMLGNNFMSHSHIEETGGVSILPPGVFTAVVTFLPPPLDIGVGDEKKKQKYMKNVRDKYLLYFNKMLKSRRLTNNTANWKEFVLEFSKSPKQ